MAHTTILLPWATAPLHSAAARLLDAADAQASAEQPNRVLDLRSTLLVLPGTRAARRLLELLVVGAAERSRRLVPPRFATPGRLLAELYGKPARRTLASAFEARCAWLEALRSASRDQLELAFGARFADQLPARDWRTLWTLAGELEALRAELEVENCTIEKLATEMELDPLVAAWEALALIEAEARRILAAGQRRWPERVLREAIDHPEQLATSGTGIERIIAIAVPEWNGLTRRALLATDLVVEFWVHAREEDRDAFDACGIPRCQLWERRTLPLPIDRLITADQPADQAAAVVGALTNAARGAALDDVALGVLDPTLIPFLEHEFLGHGIATRDAAGSPIERSNPHTLIAALAEWHTARSFPSLARLARHAHAHLIWSASNSDEVVGTAALSSDLDRHWEAHLQQQREAEGWIEGAQVQDQRARATLEAATAALESLCAPLDSEAQSLAAWVPHLRTLLLALYGGLSDPDHATKEALIRLVTALEELSVSEPALVLEVDSGDALQHWLACSEELPPIPPAPRDAGLDLLGALELHLDDAPVLVLAGLNEGRFPAVRYADRWLPDGLRRRVGLPDARQRSTRDAYLLDAMLAPRRTWRIVYGRRSAEDENMLPSRLLLRAPLNEEAERVLQLLERTPYARPVGIGSIPARAAGSALTIPKPLPLSVAQIERLECLPVSAFKAYLACPYRFYLKYALRLEVLEDRSAEMDARLFGTLAHDVLQRFGQSEARDEQQGARLRDWFSSALEAEARKRFGTRPLVAVEVQVEMLRRRLHAFADWQAAWAKQGWRIWKVEYDARAKCERREGSVHFHGRIDRIDIRGSELCVFDYKTGESSVDPMKAHGVIDAEGLVAWSDLQLPLYRILARSLAQQEGLDGPVQLGYLRLPKKLTEHGAEFASWSEEQLDAAELEAVRIAAAIRAEEFWPPSPDYPIAFDDFAALCQRRNILLSIEDEDDDDASAEGAV